MNYHNANANIDQRIGVFCTRTTQTQGEKFVPTMQAVKMRVRISLCYCTGRVNISCACTAACICHLFITHHSYHGLWVGYSELINVLIAAATGALVC